MSRSTLRDGVLALSVSNLLMLREWGLLLSPRNQYFLQAPTGTDRVGVSIAATLVIGAVLFGFSRVVRRHATRSPLVVAGRTCFVAALVVGLNGLRQQTPALSGRVVYEFLGVLGGGAIAFAGGLAAYLAWRRWGLRGFSHASEWVGLALAPLVVFTLGTTALDLAARDRGARYRDRGPADRLPPRDGSRVLVVLFDGLDQDLLFTNRPRDLSAPAFDSLRRSAATWNHAYPPSCSTLVSVPALITGRALSEAVPVTSHELRLAEGRSSWSGLWSREPNLFSRARSLGANATLIGWYHPYCRVLGGDLTRCRWLPYFRAPQPSAWRRSLALVTTLIDTVPGAYRLRGALHARASSVVVEPEWHVHLYREIHRETVEALRSGDADIVFAHYPIPHEPYVYDRGSEELSTEGTRTYTDNLALADRTLAELLHAVESSPRAAATALIITADHGLRRLERDQGCETLPTVGNQRHRVPLLIRLPGQERPLVYSKVVRTTGMQAAALAVLSGEARQPEDLAPLFAGTR